MERRSSSQYPAVCRVMRLPCASEPAQWNVAPACRASGGQELVNSGRGQEVSALCFSPQGVFVTGQAMTQKLLGAGG